MRWLSGSSRWYKQLHGFYPDNLIHCKECGNYPRSGLQAFKTTTHCCIVLPSLRDESEQSKLISFSRLF